MAMPFTFRPNMIFDVGMNDGQDTAYYLYRGFDVVAVEANPALCATATQRFSKAVGSGALHIENVAVGMERSKLPFYVSSKDIWSSFDHSAATKEGSTCTTIEVTCVRAADLFAKYGVPYYLKIDIEGADGYCLADLDAHCLPKYVSFECGPEATEEVWRLNSLGYKRFKLINQLWKEFRSDYEPESMLRQLSRRLQRKSRNVLHGRWYNDWLFEFGSSGPFGEHTDGRWVSARELLEIRARWEELNARNGGSFWFDVHAAR